MACIKPPTTHNTPLHSQLQETTTVAEETVDHGYTSDPNCVTKQTSSSSLSTSSSKSSGFCDTEVHEQDQVKDDAINPFKAYLEAFIVNLQSGIEAYVRPSLVLNVLSQSECFVLYQNVEKLVPIAKFLLNIISQFESLSLVNVDSLNIVFTAFKTYLGGLTDAMDLLGRLTSQNDSFMLFLDSSSAMPIVDFIFMPFSFVCRLVEFFEVANDGNKKLSASIERLYECTAVTQIRLEQRYQANEESFEDEDISFV